MKEALDAGEEVRIVTDRDDAPDTDISMSIAGRTAVNSAASVVAYDSHNLPSGEVFTAPTTPRGRGVLRRADDDRRDPRSGRAPSSRTARSSTSRRAPARKPLASVLDTDPGARRLGELGIGMNRGIDRFTDSILFDEKMGDTIHLAVGRAYDACRRANRATTARSTST